MHDESVHFKRRRSTGLQRRSLTWLPLKLASAYFIIAALWILGSDFWLGTLVLHPDSLTSFQSIKGLLFVSVTTLVLYGLSRRSFRLQQQADMMLRESEERLRLILQNMPVMLSAFDDQNNMSIWNHECERVTGYSAAEIIGNPQAMTLLYPEATYRQQMVATWAKRGNNYRDWEWEMTCSDGSVKTVAWSNIADCFPVPGWLSWGIGVDVTDRKQTEAALHARNREVLTLHKISEITLKAQSLKAAFQDIVKEISAATAFPIVAIELYDAARQVMVFEGTEGIPLLPDGKPIEVPVTQASSRTVVETGQMLVETYNPQEPNKFDTHRLLGQLEIKTFICVPMTVNQTIIGVLSLAHPEAVSTKDDFLQWLTSLANYLAVLTDRQRTEIALRENEEFFKLALDFNRIGSWDWHVARNEVIWNDNHARLLGFVPGEVQASYQAWRNRVHPDDISHVEEALTQALATRADYEAEYRVIYPNEDCRWIVGRGRGLYDASGQVNRMIGVVLDITDRKQAEQKIQQLNQTLEQQNLVLEALVEQRTAELVTFINTLPDYIFVIERDTMQTLFCNDRNAWLGGCENQNQMVGKTIFECYEPELATTFAEQNQRVFTSGETLHFQEHYTTSLGTFYFDTYKIPLKKPNGEVYALIGSSRDITELVAARQALSDRTVELESVNRELESFSYSVSHDLRAPLRHISGFVAALRDRLLQNGHLTDPTAIHYLQILQDSSHQMGLLIDGLLTLSRVGRRQMAAIPVNLNQLVANVLAQLSHHPASDTAITGNDAIQFIIGDLPTVKGDATLLHQVFVNLLDNAIKFSRPHPAPIEVAALADGTIFVRDRGVGFQMEYADQLFGAFQRLHSRSEFEGTGIGLAIVQRIIHRHNGTIWVESQPGQGTTFYFKLGDHPSTP
ncbi:PAS domain S-box protein [Leptolyngbya sp. FACHB-321]|uniref:PAS domain S-box protein n=1 Tax=Leptolyngbya sp. FACHB-321 TaxID=2692807 RepID=UPI00168906E1|nr:PAS domain S-box protein [Leptolyngbya sp. FACHB-321]MBD2036396.1 PAS domain S-box protein [Leptolyngbya sp. FACHB-321]